MNNLPAGQFFNKTVRRQHNLFTKLLDYKTVCRQDSLPARPKALERKTKFYLPAVFDPLIRKKPKPSDIIGVVSKDNW